GLRACHAEVRPGMSVRINLLPHREERRKRARQHFAVLAGVSAVVGLAVVGAMWYVTDTRIENQANRNAFLKGEIAKLDKEIDEIKKLRDEIAALLARKQVIETLQADRAQTVHLLDELVSVMPEGVYVRAFKQRGLKVNLIGYSQSNARVSTLMRNIDASPWLERPELVEIRATNVANKRLSEFNINFSLKRSQAPADKAAPAKDAPKAPAPAAKKG
ncbi:MAG TPA: PilN domain-containing protein, partial [Burkholderiales bacterium]|nr:PilN domain-containing protein [Burkholderiales bacterium]